MRLWIMTVHFQNIKNPTRLDSLLFLALLSEYPFGTKSDKFRFVNRNRLIVGPAKVTVAMECREKSGSMHTIDFARKQNCPIFCLAPGTNFAEEQSGLKYILDMNIGTTIKNGIDYKNVIKATGHDIEKPTLNSQEIWPCWPQEAAFCTIFH